VIHDDPFYSAVLQVDHLQFQEKLQCLQDKFPHIQGELNCSRVSLAFKVHSSSQFTATVVSECTSMAYEEFSTANCDFIQLHVNYLGLKDEQQMLQVEPVQLQG
jgi:hypothetical protein